MWKLSQVKWVLNIYVNFQESDDPGAETHKVYLNSDSRTIENNISAKHYPAIILLRLNPNNLVL